MKKYIRSLIIAGILIILAIILTGCENNIPIKTQLLINEDGSGYRRMYYEYPYENRKVLAPSIISEAIERGLDSDLIEFQPPESSVNEEYFLFECYIRFDSIEEYEQKVQDILNLGGINLTPEVKIKYNTGKLGNYTSITENFTTVQLLRWLEIAGDQHVQNYAEDSLKNMHFYAANGDTQVIIDGQEYNVASGAINFEKGDKLELDGCTISSTIISSKSMNRKISVLFTSDVTPEGKTLIEDLYGSNSNIISMDWIDDRTIAVEFEGDFSTIEAITSNILERDCSLQVNEVIDENDAMILELNINEDIDGSAFQSEIKYIIENDEEYAVSSIKANNASGNNTVTENINGAWNLTSRDGRLSINFTADFRNYVKNVFIELTHISGDIFTKQITFKFKDEDQFSANALKSSFDNLIGDTSYTSVTDNMLNLRIEGTIDKINEVQGQILGPDNTITIESNFSSFNPINTFTIIDSVFLQASVYSLGRTEPIQYKYTQCEYERLDKAGDDVMENGAINVISGTSINIYAIYLFGAALLIALLLIILIILIVVRKKRRRSPKIDVPEGGYMTSGGVVVLPSKMAVPVQRKNINKDVYPDYRKKR